MEEVLQLRNELAQIAVMKEMVWGVVIIAAIEAVFVWKSLISTR